MNRCGQRERNASAVGAASTALWLIVAVATADAAPMVFFNGRVVTVDPAFSIVDAFAIDDGRIVAVGDAVRGILASSPDVQRVDLRGGMVLPGLIDSHTHPIGAATHEFDHPIPDIRSIADLLAYVAARATAVPEGSKIVVRQVFITRLAEQRYPTREELDRTAPRHPVVFSTGPDSMLNTLALSLAGIDRESGDRGMQGGRIERDVDGEPTGLVRGFAPRIDAPESVRTPTAEETDVLLRRLFADYNRVGLTTVADRGASASGMAAYERLRDRGELSVRVRLSHTLPSHPEWDRVAEAIAAIGRHPLRREDPLLRIVGTKIWLDGGMLTGSALMQEPWGQSRIYGITDPAYRGAQNVDRDRLVALVRAVAAEGMQFTAHAVGDGAVALLLDAYREVDRERPLADLRPCLTHSNFMSPESIADAARMGVVVDLQPVWLHLDGDTLLRHFGDERMRRFQPLRPLFDAGVVVGGGSDHMQKIGGFRSVNPYNPFLGIWAAVTRQARRIGVDCWPEDGVRFVAGRSLRPIHPEHALAREEAIRMYTIQNAKVLLLDGEVGSIEPGKRADFVVLDRDLLTCSVDDMPDTRVLETWLDGRRIAASR